MIIEAVSQLLSGNLFWFVEIVINNLHWTFALFAYTVIAYKEGGIEKNHKRNFIFLMGLLWAWVSLAALAGITSWPSGSFYLVSLGLFFFLPKKLKKFEGYLNVAIYILLGILFTLAIILPPERLV